MHLGPYRLTVRTLAFQASNPGSIPGGATKRCLSLIIHHMARRFFLLVLILAWIISFQPKGVLGMSFEEPSRVLDGPPTMVAKDPLGIFCTETWKTDQFLGWHKESGDQSQLVRDCHSNYRYVSSNTATIISWVYILIPLAVIVLLLLLTIRVVRDRNNKRGKVIAKQ